MLRPAPEIAELTLNMDATCSFFYIRRYYPPTLRSYFLPAKGLHIKRLGIHLRAPPPRIPRDNPPNYLYATEYVYGARRRRRRGRQTVGDTVGEGGARMGERDEDDMFDVDLAERGSMRGVAVRDELPRYYVDAGLPLYEVGDGAAAEEAERIRAEAAVSGAEADLEALPTAAEYEAASRAARSQAMNGEVGGVANEGQGAEDAGEGREEDGEADPPDGSRYPPRPPPIVRSTTGRSSLFATLYRSRTAGSNPPQRPPLRHVASDSSRPRGSDDGIAASLASTSTVSTTIEGLPTVGRTLPYDSGATGSTSDVDPLGSKTRVKQLQPSGRPKLPEASSSMAKIDPEESAKEAELMEERVEVVEEQDATFRIEDSDDDERSPADPAPPSSATDPQSRPT